jgi:hypothetical protein
MTDKELLVDGQFLGDVCNPFSRFPKDPLTLECKAYKDRLFMTCETVQSMLNDFVFKAVTKKTRTYLVVDWEATEKLREMTGDDFKR